MTGDNKGLTMSFGAFSCTLEGFDNPFETMKSVADFLQEHALLNDALSSDDAQALIAAVGETVDGNVGLEKTDSGVVLRHLSAVASTEPDNAAEIAAPISKGAGMLAAHFAKDYDDEGEDLGTDEEPEKEAAAPVSAAPAEPARARPTPAKRPPAKAAAVKPTPPPAAPQEEVDVAQAAEAPAAEPAPAKPATKAKKPLIASPNPAPHETKTRLNTNADKRAMVARIASRRLSETITPVAPKAAIIPPQTEDKKAAINKLRDALKNGGGATPKPKQPPQAASPAPSQPKVEPAVEQPQPAAESRRVAPEAQTPPPPPPVAAQAPAERKPKPVMEQLEQNTRRMAEMTPEERLSSRNLTWGDVDDLADRHFEKASTEKKAAPDEVIVSDPNAERDADEAARRAEQKKARRAVLTNDNKDKDGFVERLMNATSYLLKDDRSSNRRASIAHMKAAVAATKADSSIKNNSLAQEEKAMHAYRQDLARAVDRAPNDKMAEARSNREDASAPQPDTTPKRLTDDPESDVINQVAQALQGSTLGDKARAYIDKLDEEAQIGATIPEPTLSADSERVSFKSYATRANALELPDLMEAAAAYLTYIEGTPYFTRPTLLRKASSISSAGAGLSREAGLRSFGKLLREGKLHSAKGGKYTISKGNKYEPQARYAG